MKWKYSRKEIMVKLVDGFKEERKEGLYVPNILNKILADLLAVKKSKEKKRDILMKCDHLIGLCLCCGDKECALFGSQHKHPQPSSEECECGGKIVSSGRPGIRDGHVCFKCGGTGIKLASKPRIEPLKVEWFDDFDVITPSMIGRAMRRHADKIQEIIDLLNKQNK